MGGADAVREMQRFDRVSQLHRLHQRLVASHVRADNVPCRRYSVTGKALPFPPPPFPDTASIKAIRTPDELQAEAKVMAHCISGYCGRIYDGVYAVYRVLAPERLTLGLRVDKGKVHIDQLRGFANKPPSGDAWEAVEHWFAHCLKGYVY